MNKDRLKKIFASARGKTIMVFGDVMVDEFLYGKVDRISPEAPVPVLEFNSHVFLPGGAANAANNIRSLGGEVALAGCIGEDFAGERLLQELARRGISTDGLITASGKPTTLKTRVIAHTQQVVRIDREERAPINSTVEGGIKEYIKGNLEKVDAVLVSDYGKGTVTEGVLKELVVRCREPRKPIVADSKTLFIDCYKGVAALTPNVAEAERFTGIKVAGEESLVEVGRRLLELLDAKAILLTRAEQGMSLFEKGGDVTHIPAISTEVHDVTGAGDTVAAAFALALAAEATIKEAAFVANLAAAVVVRKVGTATATPEEVTEILHEWKERS